MFYITDRTRKSTVGPEEVMLPAVTELLILSIFLFYTYLLQLVLRAVQIENVNCIMR